MKREIKFKLYDKHVNRQVSAPACYYMSVNDDGSIAIMNNIAVCQFTGLTDKNGKEIYEGDILQSDFGDGKPTPIYFGEFACSTYETKDLATQIGFYWHEEDGTKSIFGKSIVGNMDYCEIIGNIYENPELL
jgi:uncharacterized phage protein (TIGR01671 family)